MGRYPFLTSLLVIFSTLVACGREDEGVTGDDNDVTSASWQKLLECDNGSVVLDVDTTERRHLQLVVRNASAFPTLDRTITYGQLKNASERIYQGDSPYGIFEASQFRHFRKYEVVTNASGQRPGVEAILQNGELHLRGLDLGRRGCQPYSLHSSPPDDAYPAECEATNYIFRGCH